MNQNFYQNQQQQQMGGAGYQYAQRNQLPMSQPLTSEEIRALRNRGAEFNLNFTKEDMLRAICTHKDERGFTLTENRDGTSTCTICGETFRMVNMNEEAVAEAVDLVKDILQAVKTYYIDIPAETAREYFRILPLLDRLPKFYKIALDRFNRYDNGNGVQQNNNMFGFGMFNMLANPMMGNPGMNPMMMQQPQQGGFQQPMPPQQFGGNPFAQQQFGGYPNQGYPQQDMMMQQQVQQPGPQYQQPAYQQPVAQQPANQQVGQQPVQGGQIQTNKAFSA